MKAIIQFYSRHQLSTIVVIGYYLFLSFGLTKIFLRNDQYCGTDLLAMAIVSIIMSSILIVIFIVQGLLRKQLKDFILLGVIVLIPVLILAEISGFIR